MKVSSCKNLSFNKINYKNSIKKDNSFNSYTSRTLPQSDKLNNSEIAFAGLLTRIFKAPEVPDIKCDDIFGKVIGNIKIIRMNKEHDMALFLASRRDEENKQKKKTHSSEVPSYYDEKYQKELYAFVIDSKDKNSIRRTYRYDKNADFVVIERRTNINSDTKVINGKLVSCEKDNNSRYQDFNFYNGYVIVKQGKKSDEDTKSRMETIIVVNKKIENCKIWCKPNKIGMYSTYKYNTDTEQWEFAGLSSLSQIEKECENYKK